MAKVKNTGKQPRGFFVDDGTQVVVAPGEEKEFNMTEADFNKVKELAAQEDPPLYEISGSHAGVKKLSLKEQREAEEKRQGEINKKAMEEQRKAEEEARKKAEEKEEGKQKAPAEKKA
jgi:hypothetical protein